MKILKKTGIVAGAIVGGLIGGTISVIGKVADKKLVDNVGESVTDSLIYFGGIAGNVASGAADVALGNMLKSTTMVDGGIDDLKDGGKMLIGNWLHNAKLVLGESGQIAKGIVHRDKPAIKDGIKTIGQIAVVGALTVGAIRLKQEDLSENLEIDSVHADPKTKK